MTLTLTNFLIACPLVFLGGFIDSIAGGGGLITVPAYMLAGVPAHYVLGTNKLSSALGTSVSTVRVLRRGFVKPKLAVPGIIAALIGSTLGARLSLSLSDTVLKYIMVAVLPVVAFLLFNKKLFGENAVADDEFISIRQIVIATMIALLLGIYDGFYGPGTGTFLLIGFISVVKLSMNNSYAQMKVINLSSNIAALLTFLNGGVILIPLGLACGACNMLGNYIGSSLVLKNGMRIARPVIIIVIALLLAKIIIGF